MERLRRRLRQGVLAAQLGVTQQALCNWERGTTTPTAANAQAWAAALGVEVPVKVARLLAPRVARCGTPGGYGRHRRQGEEICDPCRDAHRSYMREYMRAWRSGVSG